METKYIILVIFININVQLYGQATLVDNQKRAYNDTLNKAQNQLNDAKKRQKVLSNEIDSLEKLIKKYKIVITEYTYNEKYLDFFNRNKASLLTNLYLEQQYVSYKRPKDSLNFDSKYSNITLSTTYFGPTISAKIKSDEIQINQNWAQKSVADYPQKKLQSVTYKFDIDTGQIKLFSAGEIIGNAKFEILVSSWFCTNHNPHHACENDNLSKCSKDNGCKF